MSSSASTASNLSGQSAEIRRQCKETEDVELPPSMAPGKAGRAIRLRANYYRMAIQPGRVINHFDVKIEEENATLGRESVKYKEEKFKFMQTFFAEQVSTLKNEFAYDGMSNVYLLHDKEIKMTNQGDEKIFNFAYAPRGPRKRNFRVKFRKVASYNTDDINKYLSGHKTEYAREQIQAFDVILRHQASNTMILNGRNFFAPGQQGKDLGSGREVFAGYSQSCRAIQGNSGGTLALNIDTAAAAFLKQIGGIEFACEVINPRDGMRELSGRNFWQDWKRKSVEQSMKGVMFVATHLKGKQGQDQKTWRCNSLSRQGAGQTQFELTDDKTGRTTKVTVADYYAKNYGIRLKYPDAPCIVNGSPKNPERVKYFPMELMKIAPRQAHKGKLDEKMTSNMIRAVATPAPERQQRTNQVAKKAIENASQKAKDFGIKINTEMEKVNGRVLEAPKLDYKKQGRVNGVVPRQGAWDIRDAAFNEARDIKKWVILNNNARIDERRLNDFAHFICKEGKSRGMNIAPPEKILQIRNQQDLSQKLQLCKSNEIQLAFVVMPRRSTQEYSFIKTYAEVHYGVMTQCVLQKNVERANPQLINNLLQKVNTKMGGVNTKVSSQNQFREIFSKPVMIVGLSISHASPGSDMPSIVSAAFSCDSAAAKYCCIRKTQAKGLGIIADMENIMVEGLKAFYGRTKVKPAKIVVYRLGGSEGEIQRIAKVEVAAIQNAFKRLPGEYKPGLTVISVNKMHHTRLFAEDEKDRVGKSQNIPAGTIVDSNIVLRDRYDFYLNSAQGIQGTSRPTHYTLIHDENGLTADSLQMLTWQLCHGYARCTRSVSIPVPTYYAELDRERASRHLYESYGSSDAGSVRSGPGGDAPHDASNDNKKITVQKGLQDMYFV